MNAAIGWALAVLAIGVGYAGYGWPGVLLALTVLVFWLLLQFNQAVRALRVASARPVGTVASAVMLHSKLHAGMRLMAVLKLTRSLGTRLGDEPEVLRWQDEAGDAVQVELRDGRVTQWTLQRAAAAADTAALRGPAGADPAP